MGDTIQIVIQGGAVGLAALAIGSMHYALRTLLNHIPHMATDLRRMSETLDDMVSEGRQHRLDTVVLLAKLRDKS